jgi:hypothetical protein
MDLSDFTWGEMMKGPHGGCPTVKVEKPSIIPIKYREVIILFMVQIYLNSF